jgi:hypothetical protein
MSIDLATGYCRWLWLIVVRFVGSVTPNNKLR